MNRREFAGHLVMGRLLTLSAGATLTLEGCGSTAWLESGCR